MDHEVKKQTFPNAEEKCQVLTRQCPVSEVNRIALVNYMYSSLNSFRNHIFPNLASSNYYLFANLTVSAKKNTIVLARNFICQKCVSFDYKGYS